MEPTKRSATHASRLPQNGFNSLVVSAAFLSARVTLAKAKARASEHTRYQPSQEGGVRCSRVAADFVTMSTVYATFATQPLFSPTTIK